MSSPSLIEIETSIRQLELTDQIRLLQFLTPQIADSVLALKSSAGREGAVEAVRFISEVGDRLASTSLPGSDSLTDAVSQQRR